ncbi:sugar ABC transporter ATP-binding protein [Mesorhizobium sp. YC-39]|uniref:sugar ABC transporter ATP-binding protein n=1 Tax=unclassified Mesorhizobium TaxID=325217 RepID=UPI0021E893EF|nr:MULTISPECIES: sugar ABC transporter ATP-binding protein [unclassified Mesorhizobium]MCV3205295.1 sugar ABC transporter ATP-binding protein [Mesorhizobium sp. YC-2]MCV3228306.1 sugar ABC transporter ATP-binding protein [Mesorhizobium sp. YC-39]
MPPPMPPLVEMTGITKTFLSVKALSNVDFRLLPGEVHVLFGENGAGKSTLISILSGVYKQTSGSLRIDGQEVELQSVHDAAKFGIGTVFQEFSLVPTLRVYENVYLGREPRRGLFLDRRAMIAGAQNLFNELDFEIDVRRPVSALSRAEQQMVEIAKAFLAKARVLILDEPTASLTEKETRKLFGFIARARAEGVGIIYISHRIQEFAEIADQISVLRDGRMIGTVSAKETSEHALVELMTGRAIDQIYPEIARSPDGETVLSLTNIVSAGVHGVSVDVRAGEVLGVAGLVGSGKSRLWRSVLGLQPIRAGRVMLKGRDVTGKVTRELLRGGVFYLPPDRKTEGLQLAATARDNIALSLLGRDDVSNRIGFISPRRSRELADGIAARVDISPSYLNRSVSKLSGGNQQKVLFGKGFAKEHDIYIFDEPTVGVDMGTRSALYRLIKEIAEAGKAVVVVSSDLTEVMHLAHRLVVFSKGRVAAELAGAAISEENVLKHFFADTRVPA